MALKILDERVLAGAPKYVVLDLDNTLYPYAPAHDAAMRATEAKLGALLGSDSVNFADEFATARKTVKNRLAGTAASHSRLLYFHALLEHLGLRSQVLFALDLEQTYWRTFLRNTALFPDAKEWIRDLQSVGIRTALLTDLTTPIQFRKLIYFGIDQLFEVVVTSEEVGSDKPAQAAFDLVCEKLGVGDRAEVWMVGDSLESDIAGAAAAGMVPVLKRYPGLNDPLPENPPWMTFETFIEMRRFMKKKFGIGGAPPRMALRSMAIRNDDD